MIKWLERVRPRSSRVLHLSMRYIPALHQSQNNTEISFIQVRDSPLTSADFVHVSKELKNKDEYSQVLFSSFCRKVQYVWKRRQRNERPISKSFSFCFGMFFSLCVLFRPLQFYFFIFCQLVFEIVIFNCRHNSRDLELRLN